jgi:hypothetical protein
VLDSSRVADHFGVVIGDWREDLARVLEQQRRAAIR